MNRTLSLGISILGLVAIVIGAVFAYQGIVTNNMLVEKMDIEKVTLALDPKNPEQLTPIRSAADAQKAADLIAGHRRAISPSYQELLGSGRYDPTNPRHLSYAQAMNLENYLYLGVTAFGLVQVVMGTAVFMIVAGVALGLTGVVLFRMAARAPDGVS